jgi:CspA family cold shock protein
MPTGVVKNFNALKGIGMIVPDDGGKDAIAFGPDFFKAAIKGVADGKKVSYDLATVKGKPVANNIKLK